MQDQVSLLPYIVRFAVTYIVMLAILGVLVTVLKVNASTSIATLIVAVSYVAGRFVMDHQRMPTRSERSRLTWASLGVCTLISFVLVAGLGIFGGGAELFHGLSWQPVVVLIILFIVLAVHFAIMWFFYWWAAKMQYRRLQKGGARRGRMWLILGGVLLIAAPATVYLKHRYKQHRHQVIAERLRAFLNNQQQFERGTGSYEQRGQTRVKRHPEKETEMYALMVQTLRPEEKKRFDAILDDGLSCLNDHFMVIKTKKGGWKAFLQRLDRLNDEPSLLALKVVVAFLYRSSLMYHHEELKELLFKKQEAYFLNAKVPRRERIAFGLETFKTWPSQVSQFRSDFTEPLEKLIVQEVKADPEYVLSQLESLHGASMDQKSYIVNYGSDPLVFLEFAQSLKEKRPALYINALRKCLYYRNDEKCHAAASALYDILASKRYLEGTNVENSLQGLLRYADMNATWYGDACRKLWTLESQKSQTDKSSLQNYFLIAVNCEDQNALTAQVMPKFRVWAEGYKSIDLNDTRALGLWMRQINRLFQETLRERYAAMRNVTLPTTIERAILDELVVQSQRMTEWFGEHEPKSQLLLLQYLAATGPFDGPVAERYVLAESAMQSFITQFEALVRVDVEAATAVFGRLLKSSRCFEQPKRKVNVMLDHVYGVLQDVAPKAVEAELEKAIAEEKAFYEKYDRGGPSYWTPARAARDKEAPVALLRRLVRSKEEATRANVAGNHATPDEVLIRLSQNASEKVRVAVARNTETPSDVLNKLSRDKSEKVRVAVARNTETSIATLAALSKGKYDVVEAVAQNPATDGQTLKAIYRTSDQWTRYMMASNPSLPKEILDTLAGSRDVSLRSAVAKNSAASPSILTNLSKDSSPQVRKEVASNPNTPADVLNALGTPFGQFFIFFRQGEAWEGVAEWGNEEEIRRKVASNPATSDETLGRLLEDEDWFVVSAAKRCAKQRGLEVPSQY